MTRLIAILLAAASLSACHHADRTATATKLSLSRLDCGKIHVNDFAKGFSDTPGLYPPGPYDLTDSCYLIRHGNTLMLWDTGFPATLVGHPFVSPEQTASLDRALTDELRAGGVTPEQIAIVGISHYHADHTGQAGSFPKATLLLGQADFDALKKPSNDQFFKMGQQALANWLTGPGKADPVTGDRDVFGDGSVVMLDLPGHTPGHHSLLVRLKSGPVLLSGDLYHAEVAREKRGVPPFNTDRAQTLASIDEFEAKAKDLHAKVVIQHEPADIGKVPAFPQAAE